MKKQSRTVRRRRQSTSPSPRHLPLVEILIDTQAELQELVVASGLKVLEAMLEEDRTAVCGPRYAHQPERQAYRAGHTPSQVVLGGRKVAMRRPRARRDGTEVPLPTVRAFTDADPLNRRVVDQMLIGVATRQYARSLEPLGADVTTRGTSKSAVSRRFVAQTQAQLDAWRATPLDALDLAVLLIDGVHVGGHCIVVALAARGESRSYEGSTQSIRRTTLTRMAMGTRETDQPPLWIATSDLPTSPGHPFYARLTTLLDGHHVDRFVEGLCDRFYAPVMGRPSLAPGRYFRLLLVGSFDGIDSERGIAWRATDSLAVRRFLRLAVDEAPPDHSTMARTRRLIDLETHRTVFTWVQQRLVEAGRLTGKTIAIDATTLEATAAMRSIVRRDTGESDQAFLAGLATASGVETPTREGLARLDRKRKKKTSNTDGTHPHDPDAKVTKMKDGRTHLAHKAEHAVDMETGAIVAVTRPGADVGDTTTIIETAIAATEQVEDAQANVDDRQSLEEIVGDKGYHSNQTLIDLDAGGIRSYVSEPDRGRRDWSKDPEARAPVYGNRRRMRGRRGRRLMRQRGERIERSFGGLYIKVPKRHG